jgi:pimeloyl-ACP methyl ester carboxylesterase
MTTPLVLLPGLLNDGCLWQHQVKEFGKEREIFVPNLTKQTSIKAMAEYVLELVPDNFMLGGLSMGGYVALEIMVLAPERVQKLALLNTSARPDTAEMTKMRQQQIKLAGHGTFKGITPRILPHILHESNLSNTFIAETLYDMARRIGRSGFINQQTAILSKQDHRPLLKTIQQPTLIIGGEADRRTPPVMHEEMHQLLPNSLLHILENAGHMSALEQPERVNALLREWIAL